jgi:hypothetical protein
MNIVGYKSTWLILIILSVMSGTVVNAQEVALKNGFEIIEKGTAQDIIKWFAEHKDLINKQDDEGISAYMELLFRIHSKFDLKTVEMKQENKELIKIALSYMPQANLFLKAKDDFIGLELCWSSGHIPLIIASVKHVMLDSNFVKIINKQDYRQSTMFLNLLALISYQENHPEVIELIKQILPYVRLSLMNIDSENCFYYITKINNPELTQMALKRYVKELVELIQEYKIDEQKDEYEYYIKPFLMFLRQLPPEMNDEARQVSGKFFEAYDFRHTAAPEDLLKAEFDGQSVNDFLKHMSAKFMNDPLYLGNMLLKGIPQKRRTKISEKIVLKKKKQKKTQEPTN